jgi:hypothetical protein
MLRNTTLRIDQVRVGFFRSFSTQVSRGSFRDPQLTKIKARKAERRASSRSIGILAERGPVVEIPAQPTVPEGLVQ